MDQENNNQTEVELSEKEEAELVSRDNLIKLGEEIKRLNEEAEKLKDLNLRVLADNKNQSMRQARELEEANKYAISNFAKELIVVIEPLQQALSHRDTSEVMNESNQAIFEGIELTFKLLIKAFEKFGITRITPLGEGFDPSLHQALSIANLADKADNEIIEVIQSGYVIHDRLLKPALVIVNKKQ